MWKFQFCGQFKRYCISIVARFQLYINVLALRFQKWLVKDKVPSSVELQTLLEMVGFRRNV